MGNNISEEDAKAALLGEENVIEDIQNFSKDPKPKVKSTVADDIPSFHVPIKIDELPSKGFFYHKNIEIGVRALTTPEIKLFSSMDEENFFDVGKSFANVINSGLLISVNNEKLSYRDLSEYDKIYLFLLIRDRTKKFDQRESNLTSKSKCPHCDCDNEKTIEKDTLGYYNIPDKLMKYYNSDERCFIFESAKFESPLKIYVPSLGTTEIITEYMKDKEIEKQSGDGGYYNPTNLNLVMYSTPKSSLISDYEVLEKMVGNITEKWTLDKYNLAIEVCEMLKVGIKPVIKYNCKGCSREVSAPIRFQGWRFAFSSNSIISEFF